MSTATDSHYGPVSGTSVTSRSVAWRVGMMNESWLARVRSEGSCVPEAQAQARVFAFTGVF